MKAKSTKTSDMKVGQSVRFRANPASAILYEDVVQSQDIPGAGGGSGGIGGKEVSRWRSIGEWSPYNFLDWRSRFFDDMPLFQHSNAGDYSPDTMLNCIFRPAPRGKSRQSRSRLLNIHDIIAMEELREGESVPPGLFRFLTDQRAKVVDSAILISVGCSFAVFPLTFIWGGAWADPRCPGGRVCLAFDMLLDLIYLCCLLLQLNMSFYHPRHHVEVVRRGPILFRQLTDPLWWISILSCMNYIWIGFGAELIINNIKGIRIRHLLAEMPDSLWRLRDKASVRLVKPIILLCLAANWVACLLAYFGGYREALENSGSRKYRTTYESEVYDGELSLYLMALVEAVYMLTGGLDNPVGEGTLREKKFPSLIIVAVFGPIGCVVVSLFIASVVNQQARSLALSRRHDENKAFIAHALRILNIPKPLQSRVFSLHYYQKMGHDKEAFDALFNKNNLSPALENALLVWLYRDTVCCSEYFINKDPNYIIEVLRVLEFQVFLPGDYVARKGEIASAMYFVSRGRLAVLVPTQDSGKNSRVSEAKQVGYLRSGQNFGEVALVDDCVRTAWVRAESYALVSALSREKVEPIWKYFPEEKAQLHKQVLQIKTLDRSRLAKHRWWKAYEWAVSACREARGEPPWKQHTMSNVRSSLGSVEDEFVSDHDSHFTTQRVLLKGSRSTMGNNNSRRTASDAGAVGIGLAARVLDEKINDLTRKQTAMESLIYKALDELRGVRRLVEDLGKASLDQRLVHLGDVAAAAAASHTAPTRSEPACAALARALAATSSAATCASRAAAPPHVMGLDGGGGETSAGLGHNFAPDFGEELDAGGGHGGNGGRYSHAAADGGGVFEGGAPGAAADGALGGSVSRVCAGRRGGKKIPKKSAKHDAASDASPPRAAANSASSGRLMLPTFAPTAAHQEGGSWPCAHGVETGAGDAGPTDSERQWRRRPSPNRLSFGSCVPEDDRPGD